MRWKSFPGRLAGEGFFGWRQDFHNYRLKGLILGCIHNMISNVFIPSVGLGNIERIEEEALPECLW